MANIWISVAGDDNTGDGSINYPFKTFEHSYSVKGEDNKYIFTNDGENGQSIFEEESILLEEVKNVTLLTDYPRNVFIKTDKINIKKSENIIFSGISFIEKDPDETGTPFFLTLESSTINFYDVLFQEIHRHIIDAQTSNLECNKLVLDGKLSTITLLNLKGISSLKGNLGISCTGEYDTGIIGSEDLKKVDITSLNFEGFFKNGIFLNYGTALPSLCNINNVIIKGELGLTQKGIEISGANNDNKVATINKALIFNCGTAISLDECFLIITNATFNNNLNAVVAENLSLIDIKNCIFTENNISLQGKTNSNIDLSFSNLYNNINDFPKNYIPIEEPEVFRIFSDIPYELLHGFIEQNSEQIKSEDGAQIYIKDKDYTFSYGSEFVVGNVARLNTNSNIPDGEKIIITYNYKNPESITGNVTLGQRIRRVDPKYNSIEKYDFSLSKYSPLIDAGIFVGYGFKGTAPDMGFFERSKPLSAEEALTQLKLKSTSDAVFLEPDVKNTINLQVDNIKAYNKEIDLSEGSAIRDLLIKPASHLIDSEKVLREHLMKQQSILFYDELTDNDMDKLAANYMINRKNGQFASGSVRLYFKSPDDIVIPSGSIFTSNSSITYFTLREQTFLKENVSFNVEGGLYFVDVPIYAMAEGEIANAEADSIRISATYSHPNLVNVNNPFPIEGGLSRETNSELNSRLETAWSLRSLTSTNSINSVLVDNFAEIRHITTIGAGDSLMNRDIIKELIPFIGDYHTYGKIDIYLSLYKYIETSVRYLLDSNAQVKITNYNTPILPLIYIKQINIVDTSGVTIKTVNKSEYFLTSLDENYRFSSMEELILQFLDEEEYSNLTIDIIYVTSPIIQNIQDFVNQDNIRNVCTDIVIKNHIPTIVSCYIDYNTDLVEDISESIASNVAFTINGLEPGQVFNMSLLSDPIIGGGAISYSTPLIASMETWGLTGSVSIISVDGEFDIEKNAHYISGEIIVNKIEV